MIKICDSVDVKLLSIILSNCILCFIFPDIWKKSNEIHIYRKGKKQCLKNYPLVFLLPIRGKVFERERERVIFNQVVIFKK